MSILHTPEIDALRIRVNAFTRRKELEFVKRNPAAGISRAPYGDRFLAFVHKIERFERAGVRFAVHVSRVSDALAASPFACEHCGLGRADVFATAEYFGILTPDPICCEMSLAEVA